MVVDKESLAELHRAYRAHENATRKLHVQILKAHEAGNSLRAISMVVGLAPESVRTIVREERERRDRVVRTLERPIASIALRDREREEGRRRALARSVGLSVQKTDSKTPRRRGNAPGPAPGGKS